MAPSRRDRIAGGIWGLLIGDALGVPYEFHPPAEIPPADAIEFTPPPGFVRAHTGIAPGTWSDDGAHALCLLASLLHSGRFDAVDFAQRIVRWYDEGYLAINDHVFDVGVQTGRAIASLKRGVPALTAGPAGEHDNGNGALMRVLPLALWHRGSDAELCADAMAQSRVTHGHLRSQLCCALYCLWARRTLEASSQPWREAVEVLRSLSDEAQLAELEFFIRPDDEPQGRGTGYVVDCLRSAQLAMQGADYQAVVRAAIALGHDTDTTACVAGGIAGIRDGIDAIPVRWRSTLLGRELVTPLLNALLG